jgi:hypothetical protein
MRYLSLFLVSFIVQSGLLNAAADPAPTVTLESLTQMAQARDWEQLLSEHNKEAIKKLTCDEIEDKIWSPCSDYRRAVQIMQQLQEKPFVAHHFELAHREFYWREKERALQILREREILLRLDIKLEGRGSANRLVNEEHVEALGLLIEMYERSHGPESIKVLLGELWATVLQTEKRKAYLKDEWEKVDRACTVLRNEAARRKCAQKEIENQEEVL